MLVQVFVHPWHLEVERYGDMTSVEILHVFEDCVHACDLDLHGIPIQIKIIAQERE